MNEIILNNEVYVKKQSNSDLIYAMVRTETAGVFAGYIESYEQGNVINLKQARRIWYWEGAASLSQLAMEGTSKPNECKFPCEVDDIKLFGVIEVIPITEKAKQSIASVSVWKE